MLVRWRAQANRISKMAREVEKTGSGVALSRGGLKVEPQDLDPISLDPLPN